jgi:hypothetical protein
MILAFSLRLSQSHVAMWMCEMGMSAIQDS